MCNLFWLADFLGYEMKDYGPYNDTITKRAHLAMSNTHLMMCGKGTKLIKFEKMPPLMNLFGIPRL